MALYTTDEHYHHKAQPILVAGEYDDLDPFSDTSNPVSPFDELASPVSNFPDQEEEEENDEKQTQEFDNHKYATIKQTYISCCRCPNEQPLGASWSSNGSQDHALCERCTAAFCSKCTLHSSTKVIQFDSKGKAHIPPGPADVLFFSFCPSCGGMEAVPARNVKRINGVAYIDGKGLSCPPCRQKTPAFCLKVAWVRTEEMGSSLPGIPEQDPIEEMGERPAMPARYSDGYLSLRQRMSFMSGKRNTVNKMRRWTSLSSYGRST